TRDAREISPVLRAHELRRGDMAKATIKAKTSTKASPTKKAAAAPPPVEGAPKKLSASGASPWAARHAAKHAAEAQKRAAAPAPPGSARSTIRAPEGADLLKAQIGELHTLLGRIEALAKRPSENYYEI